MPQSPSSARYEQLAEVAGASVRGVFQRDSQWGQAARTRSLSPKGVPSLLSGLDNAAAEAEVAREALTAAVATKPLVNVREEFAQFEKDTKELAEAVASVTLSDAVPKTRSERSSRGDFRKDLPRKGLLGQFERTQQ